MLMTNYDAPSGGSEKAFVRFVRSFASAPGGAHCEGIKSRLAEVRLFLA